jgi:hypothetical protein
MRPLILNSAVLDAIEAADARARAKPIPWEVLQHIAVKKDATRVTLEDRMNDHFRPRSESVDLGFGYRVAVSYEEQPAGLVKHLSMSVDTPGNLPGQFAVMAIMKAFKIDAVEHAWLEEFEPGHSAVNVVVLVEPSDAVAGHA